MSLWEIKVVLDVAQVDATDDVLLERGDERWSLMHDVLIPAAWIVGVFEHREDAETEWADLAPMLTGVGEMTLSEMPDEALGQQSNPHRDGNAELFGYEFSQDHGRYCRDRHRQRN